MHVLLGTVFVASLLGSLHCVGMCGPFALLAGSDRQQNKSALIPTAAYSLGRLVTYTIIGAIFGTLGMALNTGTSLTHWQQSATYVAGVLMIMVGVVALLRCLGWGVKLPKFFAPFQKTLQSGFKRTRQMPPVSRALTIGALTSLMPCGWLYTFAITAAGTGSPLWGAALMATFWAGTIPVMTALMLGFHRIGTSVKRHIPVAMATLVIAVGIFTILYRAPVSLAGEQIRVTNDIENLAMQVNEIDHGELPCCCNKGQQ